MREAMGSEDEVFSDVYEETVAANQAESLGLLLQRSLKENARLMKILQEERRVEQERQLENCQTAAAQGRKSSRRQRPAVKVLYLAMRNSCTSRAEVKSSFVSHGF